jgi:DNA-binding MarR family transcriptional regulator
MSTEDLNELRSGVGSGMQALQSVVDTYDEAAAVVLGVNRTDLRCLELLFQDGQSTPGALGPALALTTGSVTAMLDRLEKRGHLTRSADPSDRRKTLVRIADATKARLWDLYGPFVTEGGAIIEGYSATELELLTDFLRRSRELYERQLAGLREPSGSGD